MPTYKNILNALLILSFIINSNSNSCPPGTHPFMKNCYKCKEGAYSPKGNRCYSCPPGTYSSIKGATECDLCWPGSYNPYSGNTRCQKCFPGTFSNKYGATYCENCPSGSYSDYGASTCYEKSFFENLKDILDNNYNKYNNYYYENDYY